MTATLKHGTPTAYKNHGCRCEPCTAAACRYAKRWRYATRTSSGAAVQPLRVPAGPVADHVRACLDSGWGYRELAREAGVDSSRISRLLRGLHRGIHRDVAARFLAIEPLAPVDLDEVVVDRLIHAYPDSIWKTIGATRRERIAAADQLLALSRRLRAPQRAAGIAEQRNDAPSRNEIERCLSLRVGRDFGKPQQVAS